MIHSVLRFLLTTLLITLVSARAVAGVLTLSPAETHYKVNHLMDVVEDASGRMTMDDVRVRMAAADVAPPPGGLSSYGFTVAAYWFRFEVNNPAADAQDMMLVLRTPWLDSIHIYEDRPDGPHLLHHVGDTLPFAARAHLNPQYLVDLHLTPGRHTYYLRVTSTQAFMTPVELWQPEAFHDSDRLLTGYFGMFYGVLLVMVLYNGFIWVSTRDRNYLLYCLNLLGFFAMNFSYSGFAFQYLWPESPRWSNWSHTVWIFLYQMAAVVFAMGFLDSQSRMPMLHRILKGYLLAVVLTWLLIVVSGNVVLYNAVPVYFFFFMTPLLLTSGVAAWRSGYRAARFFVLASIASLAGSLITALTVSGFVPYSFASFHAAEFGVMADVVLLALALADRINFLRAQKEAAERAVIEQKLKASALLEVAKEELERTVAERTAELARARDEAEHLARIDVLSGVSNRRYFEEVAAREFTRVKRYGEPLAVIMFDIDLFKQINDVYGHAMGDLVIRLAAGLVKDAVRSVDFVARIGGEEFIVLLPEVNTAQAVVSAERLRERMAALEVGVKKLRFTASFGVTEITEADESFGTVLQRVDQAMYRSKKAGRNQVTAA
ncbi:diguanylate cyclase [Aquabacterium sp.]|uniref:sensor domain-containing diguanylate cyclase n=1 Tax=Aquabacterium sp. TaxID=1872578 RepID=UPI0035B0D05A